MQKKTILPNEKMSLNEYLHLNLMISVDYHFQIIVTQSNEIFVVDTLKWNILYFKYAIFDKISHVKIFMHYNITIMLGWIMK